MSTKRYRVGEKVYNIPLDKVSPFKQVYPNAVEENDNESGNSNDVVVEDAIATSDQNTASTSENTSLELPQVEMGPPEFDDKTLFLNSEDQIDNKSEVKIIKNLDNVIIETPRDELFFDVSDVIGKSEQDIVRRLEEISKQNEKYQGYEFSSTVFDFTPQVKIKNKETGKETKVLLNKNDFTSTLAGISDFVLGDNSVKDNALIAKSITSVFDSYKSEDETVEEFVDRATPTIKTVSYSDRKPMQRTPRTTQYQIDAYLSRKDKVTSIGNINKLEGSDGEIIYYKGSDIRLKASKEEIQQFEALAYHNKFYAQSMAIKNQMLSEDLQNVSVETRQAILADASDDVAFTQDVEVDFDEEEFVRNNVQQNDYSYLDHQIYISERIVSDFTRNFMETESILMSEYEAGYKIEQEKYKKQITKALNKAFESELSYYDQLGKSQIKIITDQELSFIRREVDAGLYEGYGEDQLNDILDQRILEKYGAFNDSLTKTDRFKAFSKEYNEAYNDELLDLTSEWRESQLDNIQKSYDKAFKEYQENYKPSFDKIDQEDLQDIAYNLDTRHNFRNLSYLEQIYLIDSYWNGMSAQLAEDPAINGPEEIEEIKKEYYGYFYETELSNAKKRDQQSNFIRKSMVREFYQSSKVQLDKLVDEYMLANPYESYLQKSKAANATAVSEEEYRGFAVEAVGRKNRTLVKAIENSADILNSDDPQELMQNSEIKNFWMGLTSGNFSEAVPFLSGVLDLGETYDLYKISKVPEAERTQIQNMYVALNAIESQHQEALKTVSENFAVGQSVKQSIPFFLEIAITGGAYTAAKNTTVRGIKSGLLKGSKGRFKKGTDDLLFVKKGTEYKIVDNASEVLGVINGSIAQTMVNPQRWLDATYKNLTPTMSFMLTEEAEPLLGELGLTTFTPEGGEAKDDNILKAWLRGTGTTWSSYVTEKSGLYYGRAASRLGRPINAQWQKAVNNNDFLRRLTGGWIMTKYGNVSNFLQRNIGLDGFFGEFLEEIQEIPMSNIINGDITLQGIYRYDELGNRLGLDVENLRFTAKSVAGGQLLFKGGGLALNGGYSLTQRNKKITYEIEGEKFKDEEDFNSALFSLEENGLLTDETEITIKNDYSAVDNTVEVLERNGISTDIIKTGPTRLSEGDYVTANEVEIMNEIQDGDHGGKTAKETREEIAEKEKEVLKIRSEIESLENSDVPVDQKNKDKSRLKQKVRTITVQINDILKKAKDRANIKKREPIYQKALEKIRKMLPSDTKIVEFNTAEELGNKYIKDKHNASRTVDQAPLSTASKATYINNADNTEITDPELIKQIEADYNEAVDSGQGAFNSANNEILINKEKALLGGNVNVTAHEFLHRMLKTSLENNPELKIAFGEALYSHLKTLNPKGIKDKNFRGRLAAYNNKSKAEQMEEVMTLFSDAIVNGTMTYDATFAEKVGDIIRRIMQSLGVQITFEKPEDVFNFIRDYNKSIAKGELTLSQKQLLSGKQTVQAGGQIKKYADQQKKEINKISKETGLSIEQLDQAGLRFSKEISPKGKEYIEFGFDNKSLVDIINSKSSSAEERFGAVDALVERNWPVISSAIKFNPTGEISMDAIKEAISEQILGIFPEVTLQDGKKVRRGNNRLLDTYNKTTEVTTFLSSTLRPRTAEILARGKQIDAATRGVSLDEATGIEDGSAQPLTDESSTYEKSKPKINILKDFAGVPESDIISLVKPVEGDKFKQIISKYAGKTGELVFGVPAKKIMEGGANLTPTIKIQEGMAVPSEALQIQSFFRKQQNLENFVRTLPLYNVTEMTADVNRQGESIDVSRDTYGIAIGLRGLPLDYFYESFTDPRSKSDDLKVRAKSITSPKGRSKGLTTQTDVKKLKQKFRKPTKEVLDQLRKDLGITPANQRNEYTRNIGQLLKGVAKVYSINASLSGAQRNQEAKLETAKPEDVKAIKQQTADITAAQSKIAFSKSGNIVASDEIVKVMFAKDSQGKKAAEAFGYNHLDLNKKEAKEEFIDWIKNVGSKVRPRSFWEANGNLIGSGAKYKTLIIGGQEVKQYSLKGGGTVLETDPDFSSYELNLMPEGKMVFANKAQMNEAFKGIEFAPENKNIKDSAKRITLYGKKTGEQVKILIAKKKDFLNNSDKGFIDTWMAIAKDIDQNPDNRRFWAAWLEVTPQNMSHFMRVGARLSFYNTLGLENVEEHTSPATDFAFALWAFANSRDKKGNQILTESLLKKSMESYIQGSLPKVFDDLLKGDGFDYVATIPKEYRLQVIAGEIPVWIRYINDKVNAQKYTLNGVEYSGVNPNVIILANGKTLAQSYGLGVDSSLEMNQDVISVQQELLFKVFTNSITKAEAVSQLNDYVNNMTPAASSISMFSKDIDANKTNVNPRGITILDFDDTLATTKSGVRYTMPNLSGKPQPKRKAILIAGNAGAGKTTVINQLGLRKQGFKYINQDIALDWLTKNNGLPKDMNEFTREQTDKWRELGYQAAVAAKNKASKLRGQGDGVVIDGTGAVGVQFEGMAREFKNAGYDVQVVFIESSLETALERNANRSERRLTDATVRNAYEATQKNKKAFKEMVTFFPYSAKGFVEINTDNLKQGGALPSNLVETMDNFTKGYIKGRLNAEEFASQGQTLLGEGAEFDFSEFNKVVEGKTAPLFNKAMKLQGKFGPENMFVLTARPAEAQGPIFDFLKANGLNIPLKNITGLGNSTAEAKAMWVAGKFSEGYNDFYFADDALQNVQAVDDVLNQLGVKRKVQQAKIKFSKSLNKDLAKNKNYKKFRNSLKGSVLYHGGTASLSDNKAVWFTASDFDGAELYAERRDGKVYSINSNNLNNAIIIPDVSDLIGLEKVIKNKYKSIAKEVIDEYGSVDIKKVLETDVASDVISDFMDYINNNFELLDGVYGPETLYDNDGKISKGVPVIVLGGNVSTKVSEVKFSKSIQTIPAVANMLDQFDVKSKVQQAKIKFSKDLDPKFNQMLERSAGVGAQKIFSRVEAAKRGKNKGRFTFFVPPSAEDFTGLLRYFAGTGKQGDADIQFFNEALVKPFARADRAMSQMKQTIRDDYSALRKRFPQVKKKLGKLIEGTTFTNDMAIRVYLFEKAGYETPGLSKQGKAKLLFTVKTDPEMRAFADALGIISKQKDGYLKPGEYWNTENIALDLQNATNKVGRKQFLQEWVQNKEVIFSPANMNKIEAVYGTQFREALEDVLYRMENGTNRSKGKTYGQNWTNWVNNSVGAIMFFNGRSAVLQTLSTVNFINFEDNNIFAAGKAFANQKQYWSDFSFLFNSDFLRNRRAGLATNVNEAELASAVAGATNKAKAALGYLLKIGFTPTQIADSFAIASGGATYYRNRIKTYLKSGLSQEQAEARAMLDFQEIAEETQQSARPDRISQQQASNLGRVILAFANTPMQYNRLIKKAAGDLVNKRGDWRSNVSRILYYGAIQNFIFASLQNALFALAFDDDDEELTESQQAARDRKEDTKNSRILNSMFDSLARGSGVYGAALSTIKNAIFEFYEQEEKGFRADYNQVVIELLNVSPPLGSKARKLASAGYTRKVQKDVMQEMSMLDYDNPAWQAIGNVVEATTNIPMARVIRKADNLREAFNQENSAMQRVFLALGWSAWDLDVGTEVVKNEGKENEYVVTLDTKRMKQYEVEKKIDERKTEERREEARKNKIKKKEKEDKENEQEVKANIEKQKEEGDDATCAAISSKGNRCKRKLVAGKSFCTVHEKVEKSQSGEMKQCKKIKSDGNRCGIKTNSKSGLCYYHD